MYWEHIVARLFLVAVRFRSMLYTLSMSPKQGRYLARSSPVPAISNAIRHVAIGLRRSLGADVFSLPSTFRVSVHWAVVTVSFVWVYETQHLEL